MRGRKGNSGFLWIFLVFIWLFGSGSEFRWAVLLMVFILALVALNLLLKNSRGQQDYSYGRTSYSSDAEGGVAFQADTLHSQEQKARVNAYMSHRFKNGAQAIEIDLNGKMVTLLNDGVQYRTFEMLRVRYQGRTYASMGQFRQGNGDLYNVLFDTLLKMARLHTDTAQGPIVDADFTKAPAQKAKPEKARPVRNAAYFRSVINDLNNEIPNENISNSMFEMIGLLKQLGDLEEQFPDSAGKLTKLYQTYLPYLVEILKNYRAIQHVETDPNYKKNEETLQRTISQINAAIRERLIPSMSETASSNIAADMSTLEAMLRKDGMSDENDIVAMLQKQQEQKTAEQTR